GRHARPAWRSAPLAPSHRRRAQLLPCGGFGPGRLGDEGGARVVAALSALRHCHTGRARLAGGPFCAPTGSRPDLTTVCVANSGQLVGRPTHEGLLALRGGERGVTAL